MKKVLYRVSVCGLMILFAAVAGQGAPPNETQEEIGSSNFRQNAPDVTPIYVFENYFDDPAECIGKWTQQREVTTGGGVTITQLDALDLSKVLSTIEYDSSGVRQNDLDAGLKNETVFWFWKTKPEIGQSTTIKRRTRDFGNDRSNPPVIKEHTIEIKYLQTEILEVLGRKQHCHVVEEKATASGSSFDLKWLDETGMPVRIVHVVGGQTRTGILIEKSSPLASKKSADKVITPASMGFSVESVEVEDGTIDYYLSTQGKLVDKKRKLPLVLYLEGSGPTPVFWGDVNRMASSLMYEPRDFPGFHYVALSKPGVKFHDPEQRSQSEEYDNRLCLRWRVDAANAVLNQLAKKEFVDTSRILVIGHSEGADVAPWVALENKHVTHVAGLAPGGVSQMFDFILFVRKQVATGELSTAEGDARIRQIKSEYKKIFASPKSTSMKWQGETYLRWSSFFRPSMEAWCQLDKPVYLGICRDDRNTPVESGEAIELEFTRLGKTNLTSKVWPCDHYFMTTAREQGAVPTDRRLETLQEILEWAK